MRLFLVVGAALLLTSGGRGGAAVAPRSAPPTYYADVKPILDGRCVGCHSEDGIGPFPLTSYEEAYAARRSVAHAVRMRHMPPWPAAPHLVRYSNDRSLTDEQIGTIRAWVDAGAPAGDPTAEGAALPPVGGALSRVDLELAMAEPYAPTERPDEYRCFVMKWPYDAKRFVSGFGVAPGNARIVHHVIAYLIPPGAAAAAYALEAEDEEPGYSCFGDARVDDASWLALWAPGTQGTDFPEGTGVPVEPGSVIVLQMHYNLDNVPPPETASDRTKIQLRVDETVARPAALLAWLDPVWTSGPTMMIPAGAADVAHGVSGDLAGVYADGAPVLIHGVALHMHQLGRAGSLYVRRGGASGEKEPLLVIPRWDFHWQLLYQLEEPIRVTLGDRLEQECRWDNTAANQPVVNGVLLPPRDVWWGDGSRDEMCLGVLYVTRE